MAKLFSFVTVVHATSAETSGTNVPESGGFPWGTLVMILALLLVFYFLILRPQKKRDKDMNSMRSSLSVGDEVVTIGGVCGKVLKIKDDTVTVQSADSKMRFLKTAIATVTKPDEAESEEEGE